MTRRLSCLLAALALAGAVAGCGGGDDGSDDAVASLDEEAAAQTDDADDEGGGGDSNVDEAEFEDAMLEYAQCMRDNGVDMPDPEFDENGGVSMRAADPDTGEGPDPEFEAADEACSPIMEDVRPDIELDPEEQAEMLDELVAVAECMRERGHDMPDPEVSSDGGVMMRAGGPDGGDGRPDEEFEQDIEECHDEAGLESPERGPGEGPSTEGGGE